MLEAMLSDPDGWEIVATMAAALVCIGVAFLCVHWGMAE